ncbi:phosphotransferase [Nocardia brasiliensis]|uniref:phosphotransferase n=1 Tax=Nocardia brasiliensis TaxID=37326 RepID=UPI002456DCAC|nr:phosphotransferase [Nocardia brasiliensis]
MTVSRDEQYLAAAVQRAGLSAAEARLLSAHATAVYLLPREHAVARITHTARDRAHARTAVALTRWLKDQDIPVTEPLVDTAIDLDEATVTFWHHYPQQDRPGRPFHEFAWILRHLHTLPLPPMIALPDHVPLAALRADLEGDEQLAPGDRDWLRERASQLLAAYSQLDSDLGVGMVHGDAFIGNTLWGADGQLLLGDWDEAAVAPRELDLVNTYHDMVRFGVSEPDVAAFTRGYRGWDVREWNGFSILRQIRSLHTLSAYLRRARRGDTAAREELQFRINSLRHQDDSAPWRVVP